MTSPASPPRAHAQRYPTGEVSARSVDLALGADDAAVEPLPGSLRAQCPRLACLAVHAHPERLIYHTVMYRRVGSSLRRAGSILGVVVSVALSLILGVVATAVLIEVAGSAYARESRSPGFGIAVAIVALLTTAAALVVAVAPLWATTRPSRWVGLAILWLISSSLLVIDIILIISSGND